MKTNRSLRLRIAIVAGALASTQALADTAPVAKPASEAASQVKAPVVEQTRITLASLSCTRVGNRMVC